MKGKIKNDGVASIFLASPFLSLCFSLSFSVPASFLPSLYLPPTPLSLFFCNFVCLLISSLISPLLLSLYWPSLSFFHCLRILSQIMMFMFILNFKKCIQFFFILSLQYNLRIQKINKLRHCVQLPNIAYDLL